MTERELAEYQRELELIVVRSEHRDSIEAGRIGLILVQEIKKLQLSIDMVREKEGGFW